MTHLLDAADPHLDAPAMQARLDSSRRLVRPWGVELFSLEWQLSEIGLYAARFRAPHAGGADDDESFRDLEQYLPPDAP